MIIYFNIEADYSKVTEDCPNPVSAWTKLKNNFCPDWRFYPMKVFSNLMECRTAKNEAIHLFASRLLHTSSEIKSIDSSLNTSFQLLRYLSRNFDSIVPNVLRCDDKFIFNKIVIEVTRLRIR